MPAISNVCVLQELLAAASKVVEAGTPSAVLELEESQAKFTAACGGALVALVRGVKCFVCGSCLDVLLRF